MKILFIDESKPAPDRDKIKQTYFVLGGLVLSVESWFELNKQLTQIRKKKQIKGEIKWRYFSPHNRAKDNTLRHLSDEDRNEVRKSMFKALHDMGSNVRAIAAVAHVEHAYSKPSIRNKHDLYAQLFAEIASRFQFMLQRPNKPRAPGMIICDHRDKAEDDQLRAFHFDLLQNGGIYGTNFRNIVEGLFLAPSHHSVGIQFADLIAGSVFRFFEAADRRFVDELRPVFHSSAKGTLDGYGIVRFAKSSWPKDAVTIGF